MLKIRNLKLGNKPRIVLSIDDSIGIDVLSKVKSEGADIFELRVDKFKNIDRKYVLNFINLIRKNRLPIIVTIRSIKEGGEKFISDSKRLELFKSMIPLVDVLDIELSSKNIIKEVVESAHERGKLAIISYHDLKKTPKVDKLEEIIREAKKSGADIVKIAVFAKTQNDVLELTKLTIKNREKNIIVISLGDRGLISRVFFPFLGSLLTYTFIDKPFAPSQLPLKIMYEEIKRYYN